MFRPRILHRFLFSLSVVFSVLWLRPAPSAGAVPELPGYDVVIVGAGTGGCSAAIQAARMGCRVALVEETGWVGGQLTTCGVTTFDDQTLNRSGIYGEYIDRLNSVYRGMKVNNAICYWGSNTISGSPHIEQDVFLKMLKEHENIHLYFYMTAKKVHEENGAVTGIVFSGKNEQIVEMKCKVLIDATECGDVLPLTTARYRVGNSLSPDVDLDAEIQDITWVALIRRYKDKIPAEFRMESLPRLYKALKGRFAQIVTVRGSDWHAGPAPYNVRTFNAYRAVPDPDWNLPIDGGVAGTWNNITATALNWCNDYPGTKNRGDRGLTARYLEDKKYRRTVNSAALEFTIALLYYYHHDLKQFDWAVDDRSGFARSGDILSQVTDRVPEGYETVSRVMPPLPYVRESRRVLGVRTLTALDIRRDKETGKVAQNHPSSIALGEYPIDIHGSHEDRTLEAELGETSAELPTKWVPGLFQVPLECLIPEKLDGFLAAEKNISVSRMVNGAIRLHPITMLTGQAAGALAALSIKHRIPPRLVPAVLVQSQLLKDKSRLALSAYCDVPFSYDHWAAIQASALYGFIPSENNSFFAPALSISRNHISGALKKAFPDAEIPDSLHGEESISHTDFIRTLRTMPEFKGLKTVQRLTRSPTSLKRGEAAHILWNILIERTARRLSAVK